MAKLQIGLIGCGGRGRAHALGYSASDKVKIVACADLSQAAREKMAKDFDIPNTYEDYREMLAKEKLDMVSICLWTGLHYEAILAAVEAKVKAINAEKPMAPTWKESRLMHQACVDAGIQITFSHQRRFAPAFTKARQLANSGAIGELFRLEGYCSNLFDWGTHWFDMMFFYVNDEPAEWVMGQIDCSEDISVFGTPVETNGLSYIKWRNGVTGLLVTGNDTGGRCQNRLIGTNGVIEIGAPGGSAVRLLRGGSTKWEYPKLEVISLPGRETTLAILNSIESLEAGREPELSSRKAIQATELIFATYESARRRARIILPLDVDDASLVSMLKSGEVVIPDHPAKLSPEEQKQGFKLLFNGKDLSGWKIVGTEEAWSVRKGLLTCNGQGRGWIHPEKTYTDFTLRLEYRISSKGNSGIFLRTSEEGRPAYQGMEIQLLDDRQEAITKKSTGSIYDAVAPTQNPSRPAGGWNQIEISCKGPQVKVVLNGKEIINCDTSAHPDLKDRLKSGFIGLQNHNSPIDFRDIRIKEE